MGNSSSKSNKAVPPNRLALFLSNGNVRVDDYLAQSASILDNLPNSAPPKPDKGDVSSAIDIENSFSLLEPGYAKLEDGYAHLPDGTLYISVYTELGEVDGEMFDWWFSNVENTDRYRWSHPDSHIEASWDPTYFAKRPMERPTGHYVGHTMTVKCKIGAKVRDLKYVFLRPSRYFNTKDMEDAGVTACVCARIHLRDPPFGYVAVGYVMHIVRVTPEGKNELRSRFWLGDVHQDEEGFKFLAARFVNGIGNMSWFRKFRMGSTVGRDVYINCYEEMACLKNFLPHFYATEFVKYRTMN